MVGLFRTLFYLPVLSSSVATATLWFWILNPQLGLLNGILRIFHIEGPAWLYDSKLAMLAIVMMSLWAGFGGNMMIFLSGLKGIPHIYYEAARVEGANRWQMFRSITVPALTKTTFLVSTMLIIGTLQVFDQAFILTKGGPGNATITLVYYIYNNGFNNLNMGYASSISLILFFIILFMTIINQRINKAEI
jgi:multiple sugar transport system permease protein